MRMYPLRVGTVRGEDVPITAALIRHPTGTNVLVDTGAPREMAGDEQAPFAVGIDEHVVARLSGLGLSVEDVHYVVGTHMDPDHAGSYDQFPHSRIVVQRREYEAARTSGELRYEWQRAHWDIEGLTYDLVDGDTTLLDGIEIISCPGHSPGHQSVLVRLPRTGPVLITGDAVPAADQFDPDTRVVGHHDHDHQATRHSTRMLRDLVRSEGVALTLHSHDAAQWRTLADFYD